MPSIFNAFVFIVLFLSVRFVFPFMLNRDILPRLQAFAPMGKHPWAYWLYQITNILLIILPLWLQVRLTSISFLIGFTFYIVGIWLLVQTILVFHQTDNDDFASKGVYRYTRHPMYIAYDAIFLGIGLMSRSPVYILILLAFIFASHFLVLAEEAWCLEHFGQPYQIYMDEVSRYLF